MVISVVFYAESHTPYCNNFVLCKFSVQSPLPHYALKNNIGAPVDMGIPNQLQTSSKGCMTLQWHNCAPHKPTSTLILYHGCLQVPF